MEEDVGFPTIKREFPNSDYAEAVPRQPWSGDEAGLVAAIMACPADQTLWLIYADWLDENGEYVRAEVIRARAAYSVDAPANAERLRLAEEELDAASREQLYGDKAEQAARLDVLEAFKFFD